MHIPASDEDIVLRNDQSIEPNFDVFEAAITVDLSGGAHEVRIFNAGSIVGGVEAYGDDPEEYYIQKGAPAIIVNSDDAHPDGAFYLRNTGFVYSPYYYERYGDNIPSFDEPSDCLVIDAAKSSITNMDTIAGNIVVSNSVSMRNKIDGEVHGNLSLGDGGNRIWNSGSIGFFNDYYIPNSLDRSIIALGDGNDVLHNLTTGKVLGYFYAGEGSDRIYNAGVLPRVELEAGDDVYTATGIGRAEWVRGSVGNDTLQGASAADKLYGDAGDDVLAGSGGVDTLFGGVGADRFVLGRNSDIDIVNSFQHAQGDMLDLSRFGLNGFDDPRLSLAESGRKVLVVVGEAHFVLRHLDVDHLVAADFIF